MSTSNNSLSQEQVPNIHDNVTQAETSTGFHLEKFFSKEKAVVPIENKGITILPPWRM